MALLQYARGLWASFSQFENPFQTPNGMEENLRVIDDHLALFTLAPPQEPGTVRPEAPGDGDGQAYTDGSYATYNGGAWKEYPPRKGVRVVLATGSESWLNTGTGWEQYSVVDTGPATALAEAARVAAELASAVALARGRTYATPAAGVNAAGTPPGVGLNEYFTVPSASAQGAVDLYRNVAGAAVLQVGKTIPNSDAVKKPLWTGVANGWPDTFFTHSTPGVDFFGKKRWNSSNTNIPTLSVVPGSIFLAGKALQRSLQGTAPLDGPCIQVSDLGITPGTDKMTIYGLFTGTGGASIAMPVRPYNSANVATAGQSTGVSDTNVQSIIGSAVGQRLRATIDIPLGTAYVWVFPYHGTAGGTFKLEALWAFKGDETQGPDWPTAQSTFERLQLADAVAAVANQGSALGAVQRATEYGFDEKGVVSGAIAVAQGLTAPSTSGRDLPFRGWGETISAPGVPFNAIRVKTVTRYPLTADANKWRSIGGLVRVGPTPHLAGTPVAAVGLTRVLAGDETLNDVIILLRDPATGALKTVNSTDNTFIAITAQNSAGGPAALGEPRGTMPNTLGQSYYNALTGDATAQSWNEYAPANVRLGFELLLITNPVESSAFSPSQPLANALGAIAPLHVPEVVLPPTLIAEEGKEFNLFYDNVHVDDARSYSVNVDLPGSVGRQMNDRINWVPTAAMAAGVLTYSCNDKRTGSFLVAKQAQLRAVAASAGGGQTINLLEIGDSLIAAEVITDELVKRSAADPNFKVLLYGTRGTGANRHEGRGGWSIPDYTTAGRVYRSFGVTGVVTPPAINSTKYTQGATTYLVQEVALDGSGNGTVICSIDSGPDTPAASGVLTKVGATPGDVSITYGSSVTLSGNPFWIGGVVNFAQYLTDKGYPAMHAVVISLGINDVFGQASDAAASSLADSRFAQLDTLIASIKASNANTKVFLRLPSPPSHDQDSFGINYSSGQTRDRFKRNILIWSRQLIQKYAGQEANRVYLMASNVALDTANDMSVAARTPTNLQQTLVFQSVDLLVAEIPTVGATYVVSNSTWTVVGVTSAVTKAAQTLPLDEDGTKHVTIPARYGAQIEMKASIAGASAPEIAVVNKSSGTGAAALAYVEVAGGARVQNNGVHPGERGYRNIAGYEYSTLKYSFSA